MSKNSMKNLFFILRSKQTFITIFSSVLFASIIIFVLYQGTKTPVILNANGESDKVYTHAKTVGEFLEEQNLEVSQYDKITPSLETEIDSKMTIKWEQAKKITVSVDGKVSPVWTTETKVKDILEQANIEVSDHDVLSHALDDEVAEGDEIDIQKGFQLTLVDGVETKQVWSTSTTVANFLSQQGIQLSELDRVENDMEQVLVPGDKVKIVRVEKVTDVVEEPLDFAVQMKNDSSLLKGTQKVVKQGEEGLVSRTYEIVKENGKVVEKTLKDETVIKQPTEKVVAVGTKVVTASVSRGSSSTGKEFYVTATAYTPYCSGCSGKSATGVNLKGTNLKVIAVDPNVIPLGKKVWVEGYGYAIAGDTGGSVKGNKIDVLFQTEQQAINWGIKKVKVKVLN